MVEGNLLAGFRTGSAKDSADEDIQILRSEDEGQTWETALMGYGEYPAGSGGRMRGSLLPMARFGSTTGRPLQTPAEALFLGPNWRDPSLAPCCRGGTPREPDRSLR